MGRQSRRRRHQTDFQTALLQGLMDFIFGALSDVQCHVGMGLSERKKESREIAPRVFRRDEDISLSVVFAQPLTPTDRVAAEEARISCPTDAIQRQ